LGRRANVPQNPGEALERIREQREQTLSDEAASELFDRQADLTNKLAEKHKERERWLHLYGEGHISDAELEEQLADLRGQLEALKRLLEAVEGDLTRKSEAGQIAESAEAWLLALRDRLEEAEDDTEEAFRRRELVKVLVKMINVGRNEDGRAKVDITFRSGRPIRLGQSHRKRSVICGSS
jgi:chromosome segregation ATPase